MEKGINQMRIIMPKKVGWITVLVIFLSLSIGHAGTSSPHINGRPSALDTVISELNQRLKERQSEKKKLIKKSDKLAKKITKEKHKIQGRSSRKLNSMMRESQQLVFKIESNIKQIAEIESKLKETYSLAITTLVKRLEREPNEKGKNNYIKQLLRYIEASEKLKEPIEFNIPSIDLVIRENDTYFEIRQKADFLLDQSSLLKAKNFKIEVQIANLEKEKSLREKAKGFIDEIHFFDDTLLIKERKIPQKESSGTQSDKSPYPVDSSEPSADNSPYPGDTSEFPSSSGSVQDQETSISFIIQKEASDSSVSDSMLLLKGKEIDEQIILLKQQKIRLGKQIRLLSQKARNFYEQAIKRSPQGLR